MRRYTKSVILLFILFVCPVIVGAQVQRSETFREKYRLKEVVVLGRHNIRSPLSSNNSVVGRLTPHSWLDWSAGASELTLRGGVLETMMGQFFRKWLVSEGLFQENCIPDDDEVHIYANSMQRTIATAQYFASGFMPVGHVEVQHRMAPGTMDPLFQRPLAGVSDALRQQARRERAECYGEERLKAVYGSLNEAFGLLSEVLDLKESPAL